MCVDMLCSGDPRASSCAPVFFGRTTKAGRTFANLSLRVEYLEICVCVCVWRSRELTSCELTWHVFSFLSYLWRSAHRVETFLSSRYPYLCQFFFLKKPMFLRFYQMLIDLNLYCSFHCSSGHFKKKAFNRLSNGNQLLNSTCSSWDI